MIRDARTFSLGMLACGLGLVTLSTSQAQPLKPAPQPAVEEKQCIDSSMASLVAAAGRGQLEQVARDWASALYCHRYGALGGDAYAAIDGALTHVVKSLATAGDTKALDRLRDEFARMSASRTAHVGAAAIPGMFMLATGRASAGDQAGAAAEIDSIAKFLRKRSKDDAAYAQLLERWAGRLRDHGDTAMADALMKHAPAAVSR